MAELVKLGVKIWETYTGEQFIARSTNTCGIN